MIALFEWMGIKWSPKEGWPPLTLDLMHEAWLKLPKDSHDDYTYNLKELVGKRSRGSLEWSPNKLANATKEQRLEALLKTLGKWTAQ